MLNEQTQKVRRTLLRLQKRGWYNNTKRFLPPQPRACEGAVKISGEELRNEVRSGSDLKKTKEKVQRLFCVVVDPRPETYPYETVRKQSSFRSGGIEDIQGWSHVGVSGDENFDFSL